MTLKDILEKKEAGKASVVAFMRETWAHPYGPRLEEIAAGTALTASSVNRYVNELVQEGYLSREPGVYRSIALTDFGRANGYEPKAVLIPEMA